MLKSEVKIINAFLSTAYPYGTYILDLSLIFDYYNSMCYYLKRGKNLYIELIDLPSEEENRILNFISEFKGSEGVEYCDLEVYYYMLRIVILILKKYYNKDGTRKGKC